MSYTFYKYHGTGNDFILIEDRDRQFDTENVKMIRTWCHRRFGIGADGLILLRPDEETDFEMVYFNSDGRQSSMCGNGGRCIVAFAHRQGWIGRQATFRAIDGLHEAEVLENGEIRLRMVDVSDIELGDHYYVLDTGSPHYVTFKPLAQDGDLVAQAQAIRYDPEYRDEGINVNFVEVIEKGVIQVRTYERGVEAETYSCGTGVVAAAISTFLSGMHDEAKQFNINTKGGTLEVSFTTEEESRFTDVWLTGPAIFVYQGQITA